MKQEKRTLAKLVVGFAMVGLLSSPYTASRAAAFTSSESVVNFVNQGQKVVGTWTVPIGAKAPYPTVLMLHGFAGQRQELPVNKTKEGMFSRTARVLAEQGIASLRIDFRGSGDSQGAWPDTTFSTQISDARAAIGFLSGQKDVNQNKISLLGLSQGGLVAAATAAVEPKVSNLVLWSPVAIPLQTFGDLLGRDTILKGLASKGAPITAKLPWGAETTLKTGFFEDLFKINPIAEITRYNRPMLVVVGARDTTVSPQPQSGQMYLEYHPGVEKLAVLDGDHVFDVLSVGPERLDDAIALSLAWLTEAK